MNSVHVRVTEVHMYMVQCKMNSNFMFKDVQCTYTVYMKSICNTKVHYTNKT